MEMHYQKLFEKGYIGGVEIRNRVAMTAMGNGLASWDGEASPELIRFYEDRARGGCGLIFTEFTRVDETSGACNPNQLCIATRKHVRSVQRMAERVHRHGARIFVQLHHGGREAPPALNDGKQPMGPSAILNKVNGLVSTEMTKEEIGTSSKNLWQRQSTARRPGSTVSNSTPPMDICWAPLSAPIPTSERTNMAAASKIAAAS